MPAKLTKEEFISRAEKVHGDKYDYSKFEYQYVNTKSTIICPIHGEFQQSYRLHVERGNGCQICRTWRKPQYTVSKDEFVARATEKYGGYYDYSQIDYNRFSGPTANKVKIICPEHGEFFQNPSVHLRSGCLACAQARRRKNTDEFIQKSKSKFGDFYDYAKTEYETVDSELIITCPKHGDQKITPSDHYRVGCWFCKRNRIQDIWLDEIGIPNTKNHRQVRLRYDDKLYIVDGFDPETKTVYLFHGDYWHGNPAIYPTNEVNTRNGKTFGELFENTIRYENALVKNGHKVITIWENEWLQMKNARSAEEC